jgi:hypothetical protein
MCVAQVQMSRVIECIIAIDVQPMLYLLSMLVSELHSIYTEESQPFDFSFPRSMDFTAWGSRFSGILALNAFVALAQRNWPVLSMAPKMSGRHPLIVSQWISCQGSPLCDIFLARNFMLEPYSQRCREWMKASASLRSCSTLDCPLPLIQICLKWPAPPLRVSHGLAQEFRKAT